MWNLTLVRPVCDVCILIIQRGLSSSSFFALNAVSDKHDSVSAVFEDGYSGNKSFYGELVLFVSTLCLMQHSQ